MTNRRTFLTATIVAPVLSGSFVGTRVTAGQSATPGAAPLAITVERAVSYGVADGQELLLDVYRPPAREGARPAIIQIHGGGWRFDTADRTHELSTRPSKELAEAGYVVFNVDYRLTGNPDGSNRWPAQLDDVQRAVRWIRSNATTYGVDPNRVGAYGHSAGGHLASMLGVRETRDPGNDALAKFSSRVSAVVTIAGQMDLTLPYTDQFDIDALQYLLGGTAAEEPAAYTDASPIQWVDDESAAFLVMHGGPADLVVVEHARNMVVALQHAGLDVVSVELPAEDHFTIAEWRVAGPWTLAFFAMVLHPER